MNSLLLNAFHISGHIPKSSSDAVPKIARDNSLIAILGDYEEKTVSLKSITHICLKLVTSIVQPHCALQ